MIERGQTRNIFLLCAKMKSQNVQPDLTTYTYILRACAEEGRDLEARAAFEDMLAMGLYPNRTMFHFLIHVR